MSTNDELLAGLDLMVADGWKWPKLGAAAIRELEAKLEAERKISATRIVDLLKRATAAEQRLREVEAATIERCARTAETYNWIDDIRVQSPDEHQSAIVFAIRALAPERAVAGQARPGDYPEDFDQENGDYWHQCKQCGKDFTGHKRRWICKLCAEMEPASPLLPGLELDTEMLDWLSRQYVAVRIPLRYGSRECFIGSPDLEEETWDLRAAIRAAISRLKGEGRDHE